MGEQNDYLRAVQAVVPQATESDLDYILWNRTPFPFAPVSPRDLYRAASGLKRATAKGAKLCDFCHRVSGDAIACGVCDRALSAGREQ